MSKTIGSLAVGSLVKDTSSTYYGNPIINVVIGQDHDGDNTTTLQAQKIICLKAFDAKESSNSNSDRKNYGNNRYLYSNLLSWLNSDAGAGAWYTAKHSADAAPTNANVWSNYNEYDTEAGFLYGFGTDMKNAMIPVSKRTAKNTATDGGGYEDVSSKVFLLSNTEVGLANENNVAEGAIYTYYRTSSNRIAYPTSEAVSKSEYKDTNLSSSKAWYWWLRSPSASASCNARFVNTDGSLYSNNAYYGYFGVRPAYVIPSTLKVSDEPDTDGAYVIQWNSAPKITTGSDDLGEKNAPFTFSYSITDPDGDSATGKLYLDDTEKADLGTISQGETYEYTFDATSFNALSVSQHTFKITATDSNGNEAEKQVTFTKTESPVTITGTDTSLGNVWIQPEYKYTASANDSSTLQSVTEKIDGETTREMTDAVYGTEYSADLSSFSGLSNEVEHTLQITATSSTGSVAIREIKFTKLGDKVCFYTDSITTDEAAKKIIVVLNYTTDNSPELKVEATNNAGAISPEWEDITEDVKSSQYHKFTNEPTEGFGISVKVTLKKNEHTERIAVKALGLSFA